jgi:hypothetical protein
VKPTHASWDAFVASPPLKGSLFLKALNAAGLADTARALKGTIFFVPDSVSKVPQIEQLNCRALLAGAVRQAAGCAWPASPMS